MRTLLGVLAVVLTGVAPAAAHTTSTGIATIAVVGPTVTYRLTLVPAELPEEASRMFTTAAGGDRAAAERAAAELRTRVTVRAGDMPCRPGRAAVQGSRLGDDRVTLELSLRCAGDAVRLVIRDDWFGLLGDHYRTLARIDGPGGIREVAFLPEAREAVIDSGGGEHRAHTGFFTLGVEHILTGYDHLLFLAALLLRGGGVRSLLKIVTAFTVAHSVTLALAVLNVVTLPDRLVESVIAASIAAVAVENLAFREAPSRRWLVSFGFGLVHGFGFASALGPLALPTVNLAVALLSFNLGVEVGQAVVVAALLPLLLAVRRHGWEPAVVRGGSVVLALAGAVWFVQRLWHV